MTKYLLSLAAALLLLPSCTTCHKNQRPCQQATPTRCCPKANRCTPQPACGTTHTRRVGPNRHPVSLEHVTDYMPGIAPGYII